MQKLALWLALVAVTSVSLEAQARGFKEFPPDITPPTISVTGVDGKTVYLTAADIAQIAQPSIKVTDHGTAANFHGAMLADILAKVATPSGDRYKGTMASYCVVVKAKDGYRAVFAWSEVDPTLTDRKIYVVIERDGKPLVEKDGPFMTVAPGDLKQNRWVRQVTAVTVERVTG